jgi:hypothetical protein
LVIASVTGTMSSTVVTLSRKAETTAVLICSMTRMPAGRARADCAGQRAGQRQLNHRRRHRVVLGDLRQGRQVHVDRERAEGDQQTEYHDHAGVARHLLLTSRPSLVGCSILKVHVSRCCHETV